MNWDVVGIGNALMDALVVVDDDQVITELGLIRGTMHPVSHDRWTEIYERFRKHKTVFDSGGSCANTIATVGLLGARALYRGQVGDDQMGAMYRAKMEDACGHHAITHTSGFATGKCLSIISRRDAERTMLTDLGASVHLDQVGPDFVAALRSTRIAHFTGYTMLDSPIRQPALTSMKLASDAGALVSFDAADPFVVLQQRDLLWSVLEEYADIAFLNAEEAHVLTHQEPIRAARTVAERANVGTVVVKLGGKGSVVFHDGEEHPVGIRRVDAVDTTGAGDAYAGGFLYGLVQGWPISKCGALAAASAALTVSQIGAVAKDRAALAALLAEISEA